MLRQEVEEERGPATGERRHEHRAGDRHMLQRAREKRLLEISQGDLDGNAVEGHPVNQPVGEAVPALTHLADPARTRPP
jgi:hypothetical protein